MSTAGDRVANELAHGRRLAEQDPEAIWGWKSPAGRLRARRRAQLVAQGASLAPGVRALEIGAGTGMFTAMWAETGAEITAVELSPELVERARRRGLPSRVRFVAGRFEEADLNGPFDAVIGSSVLHHLEVDRALVRIRELLTPSGRMSFAEPNYLNPQVFLERKLSFLFPHVTPDEIAFVSWRLAATLARHGFRDVRIQPFDWLHPRTPRPLLGVVQRIGVLLEHMPGIRAIAGSLWIQARS